MSDLPQIDPAKVAQKLITKNGELTYQVTQLEVLAEALRDERDAAVAKLSEQDQQQKQQAEETVADITSLPPQKG